MEEISVIARKIGLQENELEHHGGYMAKIRPNVQERLSEQTDGALVVVTAMTPLREGEGKTTNSIGLCDALNLLRRKSIVTLRQPSLGVFFGFKGGASGGGKSSVEPADEINLHFTGDMHAITEAHNLLSAMLDNHVFQGNELGVDLNRIIWPRVLDVEDRALRKITVGDGKTRHESAFIITPASEIMSVFSLSKNEEELRKKLGDLVVAYTQASKQVTARDLKADGALLLLLKKAFWPNLVQTREGNAALIHGGAFANVSIGTNTLHATQTALKLVGPNGFVVTETGFGSDMGFEKFMDIVCRSGDLKPKVAVVIATLKSIEKHGIENLFAHTENVKTFGVVPVVALNKFSGDDEARLAEVCEACRAKGIAAEVTECFAKGGEGGVALAQQIVKAAEKQSAVKHAYELGEPIKQKIEKIAKTFYGASDVEYASQAESALNALEAHNASASNLPVCVAKTPFSLSDNKDVTGVPKDFVVLVKDVELLAGAGLVLVKAGDILLMPGLPKNPAAEKM